MPRCTNGIAALTRTALFVPLAMPGLFVLGGPITASAQSTQRVTMRNNLVPGHLTRHRIGRLIRRTTRIGDREEVLSYTRRSNWVRCTVDESKPGFAKTYQMVEDKPPKIRSFKRGGKAVTPTPEPAYFNLASGTTSLYSAVMTPRDSPVAVSPRTDPPEQAILAAMLDFAHWPKKRIEAGHRWQHDVDVPGFSGTQTLEFVDIVKHEGKNSVRLTMFVEGEFSDAVGEGVAFEKAQAVLHWSRLDRTLLQMKGQAFYSKKTAGVEENYRLDLAVTLKREALLDEPQQADMVKQINAFAAAATHLDAGDKLKAVRACHAFTDRWPKSVWMPAVTALEQKARYKARKPKPLTMASLEKLLSKSVIAWEAASEKGNLDLLMRTRKALEAATRDYRAKIRQLMRDKDARTRARAVFAMAFSGRPADLGLLQTAVSDKSALVRAFALAGIAERRSPGTSIPVLLAGLADEEAVVRRRACEAIAACISRENTEIVAVTTGLGGRVKRDSSVSVRLAAVRALAAVGSRVDIGVLDDARAKEAEKVVRDEIDRAIKILSDRD